MLALTLLLLAPAVTTWGHTDDGRAVDRVTLSNRQGMRVSLMDYGAAMVSLEVPDRDGHADNIVLGFADFAGYAHSQGRYAAVIGRYAGRIDRAGFDLDGQAVRLIPGRSGVTLHGGPDSYDHRLWSHRLVRGKAYSGVEFRLVSPDGDQGFPGRLALTVTYRLDRDRNRLRIVYSATTDAPTVVNLTNHGFYNLSGAGTSGMARHTFQIFAGSYAEVDDRKVPTGRLLPVDGTPLDFRVPTALAEGVAYDHSLVLDGMDGLHLAAVIRDGASGREMHVLTTEPSVQFNDGGVAKDAAPGHRGDGFALETQHLPDSPHHPDFPSTVLRPGQRFRSETDLVFGVARR